MNRSKVIRITLVISIIVSSFLVLPHIRFDNSIARWLPNSSESLATYKKFLEDFSSDALLILSFHGQLDAETILEIDDKLTSLEQKEEVIGVSKWPVKILQRKLKSDGGLSYIIHFKPTSYINPNRPELLRHINDLFANQKVPFSLAGTGVIHEAINYNTKTTTSTFLIVGILILIVVLIIFIRAIIPLLQTLLTAIVGISFMILAAFFFKIPISMAHTIIPIIILFYSTSVSMHILTHQGNFKTVFKPISLVILTTCFGVFSFALSESPVLNDFAYLGISGILGVYIGACILFYPQVFEYKKKERLSKFILTKTIPIKKVLIILLPALLLCFPGLQKLKSEIYSLAVLPETDKAYVDHFYIENNVGPYFPLEFIVDESKMARKDISRWIHEVYDLEDVGAVFYYNRLSPLLNKKTVGYQSKSNDNLYRVTFFIPLMSTSDGQGLVNRINEISETVFPNKKPELTGFMTIYSQLANELLNNFKSSLIWAFGLIFIVMLLFLRNWKLTFLAMVVNVLPVIFMLAIMGWLNIRLDMVTIPIGCLLYSIVVDDTIHVLYWFKKTHSVKLAIANSSQGIVLTSILLTLGFSVFLVSDVPPIASFGFLSLIAIIMALISDLILLPSLLKFSYGNN